MQFSANLFPERMEVVNCLVSGLTFSQEEIIIKSDLDLLENSNEKTDDISR
jgi:hypothetical protein